VSTSRPAGRRNGGGGWGARRAAAERRLAEQAARLRALEETEAAQEGYFAGVRGVIRAARSGRLRGRYTTVADALRVPAHLDTAVEIALGASLQDVITDTEAEAKMAIGFLNETRGGRATFLPLDALRPVEVPDALRKAARQWSGVLGPAADLVDFDADVAPAARVLLARVLLVDDLETATRVARQVQSWAKIVTLTGEVVVPSGAITGGTQGRPGPNLLGRKREIADLTAAVAAGRSEAERLGAAEADGEDGGRRRAAGRARRGAADRRGAGGTRRNETAHRGTPGRSRASRPRGQGTSRSCAGAGRGGRRDRAREDALAAAIAASGAADVGAQATREDLERRQAALAVRRDEARAQARALGAELAVLRERARGAGRDAARAAEDAARTERTREERTRRAEEAQAVVAAEAALEPARVTERARAQAALQEATALFERWRDARQALLAESFAVSEKIKSPCGHQSARERAVPCRLARRATIESQAEWFCLRPSLPVTPPPIPFYFLRPIPRLFALPLPSLLTPFIDSITLALLYPPPLPHLSNLLHISLILNHFFLLLQLASFT
jgi:chromosome segregation protein